MPNRILREGILDSERVNALDWEEEVFFRRLMSVVDDYGRCEAHTAKLRASLYPLKLDQVREANVERLLKKISSEPICLVRLYTVGGKRYLEVTNFRQQTRSNSKYPPPVDAQPPVACTADAQQPLSLAHLGEGVSEGGVGDEGVSGARTRAGRSSGGGLTLLEAGEHLARRMLKLNRMFNRRESTRWSSEEVVALRGAGLDKMPAEQFEIEAGAIVAFYQAEISEALSRKYWRRTELVRVLRHWPGELDRALNWAATLTKKSETRAEGRL